MGGRGGDSPTTRITSSISMNYKTYILSAEWKEKRRQQLKNQKLCQACGTTKNLQAHHMTYKRLGNEKLKNLKTLCRACHFALHDDYKLHPQERTTLLHFTQIWCRKRRKMLGIKGKNIIPNPAIATGLSPLQLGNVTRPGSSSKFPQTTIPSKHCSIDQVNLLR